MDQPDADPKPAADADLVVPPPKQTTPTQEALGNVVGPVQDVFGAGPPGGDGTIGPTTASGFLSFYPFLRLFRAVAIFQRSRETAPEVHVANLRTQHRKFYGLCIAFDFVFVLAASCLLLTAAGFAIYKTFVK